MGKRKQKDSFLVYYEWEEFFSNLKDAQLGKLFRAIFAYEKRGEAYTGKDTGIRMAMQFVQGTLDRNRERYDRICERNRNNIAKRWGNADTSGIPKDTKDTTGNSGIPNDTKNTDHEHEHEHDHDHDHEKKARAGARELISFFREQTGNEISRKDQKELEAFALVVGEETMREAISIAAERGKGSWGYVKGIFGNWQKQGRRTGKRNSLTPGPQPEDPDRTQRLKENQRWMEEFLSKAKKGDESC